MDNGPDDPPDPVTQAPVRRRYRPSMTLSTELFPLQTSSADRRPNSTHWSPRHRAPVIIDVRSGWEYAV